MQEDSTEIDQNPVEEVILSESEISITIQNHIFTRFLKINTIFSGIGKFH